MNWAVFYSKIITLSQPWLLRFMALNRDNSGSFLQCDAKKQSKANFLIGLLVVFTITSMVFISIWFVIKSNKSHTNSSHDITSTSRTSRTSSPIKIIAMHDIDWKILRICLNSYRTETMNALERLSVSLEVVEVEEKRVDFSGKWKLSDQISAKIRRLAELYDTDLETLEKIVLLSFPTIHALPAITIPPTRLEDNPTGDTIIDNDALALSSRETNFTWWSGTNYQNKTTIEKVEIYDSVRQVIAHLVRDWSGQEGASVRESIYSWCIVQLKLFKYNKDLGPILVPGAGLGRLAWEIGRNMDCSVEAIESSICMVAAAYTILKQTEKFTFALHAFAADSFSNEVDNESRYDTIYFPDVIPYLSYGMLSYTVGTFNYGNMEHCTNQYGAIVTSFFIDTATTVYDFISTILLVLKPCGLWINVGPLQWHINNQVPVSVNEFRMIVENFRNNTTGKKVFDILLWSVDKNPIRYRSHGGKHRSTYFDGYCPLRFVVRKKSD
jgi:hypothetical protein